MTQTFSSRASDGCATACCGRWSLNRVQNRLDIYFVDVQSGKSKRVLTETSDAWIDMHPEMILSCCRPATAFSGPVGATATITSISTSSTSRTRWHGEAKLVAQLTQRRLGGGEHRRAWTNRRALVYFTANEGDWRQANVFAVGLDGKNFHRVSKAERNPRRQLRPGENEVVRGQLLGAHDSAANVAVHDRGRLHAVLAVAQRRSLQPDCAQDRWNSRLPTVLRSCWARCCCPKAGR